MIREGFWYWEYEKHLPLPVECAEPFEGQTDFLRALDAVEEAANFLQAKGWSTCRICNCVNGSREYRTSVAQWPEGLRHYIAEHNVEPSKEFRNYIRGLTKQK